MDENADVNFSIPPEERKRSGVSPVLPPFVWLMIIFLVGVVLGNILWLFTADVLAFGREDMTVEITIADTDTLKDISKNLKQQGLVDYAWLFRLYAKVTHAENKIKPGTYELQTRYDYHALVKALSAGKVQRSASILDTNQGVKDRKWLSWNY